MSALRVATIATEDVNQNVHIAHRITCFTRPHLMSENMIGVAFAGTNEARVYPAEVESKRKHLE